MNCCYFRCHRFYDDTQQNNIMAASEMEEELNINQELSPCDVCGRTFLPVILKRHQKICERSVTRKRKVFNSLKQRVEGTELASFHQAPYIRKNSDTITTNVYLPPSEQPSIQQIYKEKQHSQTNLPTDQEEKQSKWKEKHEEFVQAIRAAKGVPTTPTPIKRQEMSATRRSTGSVGTMGITKRCPSCDRKFGPKSYDRHVEWCKEHRSTRTTPPPADVQMAKERLEARTKYRVPPLKRNTIRDKYSKPQPLTPGKNTGSEYRIGGGKVMSTPNLNSRTGSVMSVKSSSCLDRNSSSGKKKMNNAYEPDIRASHPVSQPIIKTHKTKIPQAKFKTSRTPAAKINSTKIHLTKINDTALQLNDCITKTVLQLNSNSPVQLNDSKLPVNNNKNTQDLKDTVLKNKQSKLDISQKDSCEIIIIKEPVMNFESSETQSKTSSEDENLIDFDSNAKENYSDSNRTEKQYFNDTDFENDADDLYQLQNNNSPDNFCREDEDSLADKNDLNECGDLINLDSNAEVKIVENLAGNCSKSLKLIDAPLEEFDSNFSVQDNLTKKDKMKNSEQLNMFFNYQLDELNKTKLKKNKTELEQQESELIVEDEDTGNNDLLNTTKSLHDDLHLTKNFQYDDADINDDINDVLAFFSYQTEENKIDNHLEESLCEDTKEEFDNNCKNVSIKNEENQCNTTYDLERLVQIKSPDNMTYSNIRKIRLKTNITSDEPKFKINLEDISTNFHDNVDKNLKNKDSKELVLNNDNATDKELYNFQNCQSIQCHFSNEQLQQSNNLTDEIPTSLSDGNNANQIYAVELNSEDEFLKKCTSIKELFRKSSNENNLFQKLPDTELPEENSLDTLSKELSRKNSDISQKIFDNENSYKSEISEDSIDYIEDNSTDKTSTELSRKNSSENNKQIMSYDNGVIEEIINYDNEVDEESNYKVEDNSVDKISRNICEKNKSQIYDAEIINHGNEIIEKDNHNIEDTLTDKLSRKALSKDNSKSRKLYDIEKNYNNKISEESNLTTKDAFDNLFQENSSRKNKLSNLSTNLSIEINEKKYYTTEEISIKLSKELTRQSSSNLNKSLKLYDEETTKDNSTGTKNKSKNIHNEKHNYDNQNNSTDKLPNKLSQNTSDVQNKSQKFCDNCDEKNIKSTNKLPSIQPTNNLLNAHCLSKELFGKTFDNKNNSGDECSLEIYTKDNFQNENQFGKQDSCNNKLSENSEITWKNDFNVPKKHQNSYKFNRKISAKSDKYQNSYKFNRKISAKSDKYKSEPNETDFDNNNSSSFNDDSDLLFDKNTSAATNYSRKTNEFNLEIKSKNENCALDNDQNNVVFKNKCNIEDLNAFLNNQPKDCQLEIEIIASENCQNDMIPPSLNLYRENSKEIIIEGQNCLETLNKLLYRNEINTVNIIFVNEDMSATCKKNVQTQLSKLSIKDKKPQKDTVKTKKKSYLNSLKNQKRRPIICTPNQQFQKSSGELLYLPFIPQKTNDLKKRKCDYFWTKQIEMKNENNPLVIEKKVLHERDLDFRSNRINSGKIGSNTPSSKSLDRTFPRLELPPITQNCNYSNSTKQQDYDPFIIAEKQLLELLECDEFATNNTSTSIHSQKSSKIDNKDSTFNTNLAVETTLHHLSEEFRNKIHLLENNFETIENLVNDNFIAKNTKNINKKQSNLNLTSILHDDTIIDPNLINENDNLTIPDNIFENDCSPIANDLDHYSVQYDKNISILEPKQKMKRSFSVQEHSVNPLNDIEFDEFMSNFDDDESFPTLKSFLQSSKVEKTDHNKRKIPKSTLSLNSSIGNKSSGRNVEKDKKPLSPLKRSVSLSNPVVKARSMKNKQDIQDYLHGSDSKKKNDKLMSKSVNETASLKMTEDLFPPNHEMYEEYKKYEEMYQKEKHEMVDGLKGCGDLITNHFDDEISSNEDKESPHSNESRRRHGEKYIDSAYGSLNRRSSPKLQPKLTNRQNSKTITQAQKQQRNITAERSPSSSGSEASANAQKLSKFCHECGTKYPLNTAKFCVECGIKRLVL